MKTVTEEYISVKEAAALMKRSTRTVKRYIEKGVLESKQFPEGTGRIYIRKSDIPSFMRQN